MKRIPIRWTSDAAGKASVPVGPVSGHIHRAVLKHGTADTGYIASLKDEDGSEIFLGGRTVDDLTANDDFTPLNGDGVVFAVNGGLALGITGGGNAKTGTLVLYVQE